MEISKKYDNNFQPERLDENNNQIKSREPRLLNIAVDIITSNEPDKISSSTEKKAIEGKVLNIKAQIETPSSAPIGSPSLHERGVSYLKKYPINKLYQLVVEGRLIEREKGWMKYDNREENSVAGVFNGIAFSLGHLNDKKLTTDFICKIHEVVTAGVPVLKKQFTPGKYRTEFVCFFIPLHPSYGRVTKEGFSSLLDKIYQRDLDVCSKYNDTTKITKQTLEEMYEKPLAEMQTSACYEYITGYCGLIEETIEKITSNYNEKIKTLSSEDQKLLLIAETIQNYELLHPFDDANGRVFVNVLLNHLLMQNGLVPATFYEPNIFDAHTPEQLVEKIREAQENTIKTIEGEDLFNFDPLSVEPSVLEKYQIAIEGLKNTIMKL